MPDGVHYCDLTGMFKVWIHGFIVAVSNESAEAHSVYRRRRERERINAFRPTEQWMVVAYGE